MKLGLMTNASESARVFYGMHMEPGTAEYVDKEGKAYKVFLNEATVKNMNKSFMGKPVYVDHVDKVDLSKVEREAAGWVVESFYNKYDGKTWCKFLVFSDAGHEAVRKGWKLSNAYFPTAKGASGRWHGMDYRYEIDAAEYEHLAIVPNPRYESSVIMDEDAFRNYNKAKEADLLTNSQNKKKENTQMSKFNFFKREKVENSADLEASMVTIGKKDMSVASALELAEKFVNMSGYAADEHMVKVNDSEEMSVGELRDCYGKMKSDMDEMKKKNESMTEEEKKKNEEKKAEDEKKANEEKMASEKKANEEKDKEEAKKNSDHFDTLRNAINKAEEEKEVVLNADRVNKGKELF